MKNFIFKSPTGDLQKMFQLIVTTSKNVLYLTHRVDLVIRELHEIKHNKALQSQVDEYFEETSPQTDTDNKEPD